MSDRRTSSVALVLHMVGAATFISGVIFNLPKHIETLSMRNWTFMFVIYWSSVVIISYLLSWPMYVLYGAPLQNEPENKLIRLGMLLLSVVVLVFSLVALLK